MKKLGIVILLMGLITLSACQSKEEAELLDRSKEFAKEYVKEEKDIEMVVEKAEFTSAKGMPTIFVDGYSKDEKTETHQLLIDVLTEQTLTRNADSLCRVKRVGCNWITLNTLMIGRLHSTSTSVR